MVYVMLGTGFEEIEALAPVDLMRRAGIEVTTVGINGPVVVGGHGIGVAADMEIQDLDVTGAEMIVLPGGLKGVASIRESGETLDAVKTVWAQGGFVAAICAGPTVLADLGITQGRHATCYPGQKQNMKEAILTDTAVTRDGSLITGASAGCAVEFGLALIGALRGDETADRIRREIVIR